MAATAFGPENLPSKTPLPLPVQRALEAVGSRSLTLAEISEIVDAIAGPDDAGVGATFITAAPAPEQPQAHTQTREPDWINPVLVHDPAGAHVVMLLDTSMDGDPETSLVHSLRLHLVSEHHLPAALMASEDSLQISHSAAHSDPSLIHTHRYDDRRFRPGRALDGLHQRFEHMDLERDPLGTSASPGA
jgi:hypothetical protein